MFDEMIPKQMFIEEVTRLDRFEKVKADYLASFEKNPAYAIEWDSRKMLEVAKVHALIMNLLHNLEATEKEFPLWLDDAELSRQKRLIGIATSQPWDHSSTNPFANERARIEAVAEAKFYEELGYIFRSVKQFVEHEAAK